MSVRMEVSALQAKRYFGVEIDESNCSVIGPKQNLSKDSVRVVLLAYANMCRAYNDSVNPPSLWSVDFGTNRSQIKVFEEIHANTVTALDLALENTGLNLYNSRNISVGLF